MPKELRTYHVSKEVWSHTNYIVQAYSKKDAERLVDSGEAEENAVTGDCEKKFKVTGPVVPASVGSKG